MREIVRSIAKRSPFAVAIVILATLTTVLTSFDDVFTSIRHRMLPIAEYWRKRYETAGVAPPDLLGDVLTWWVISAGILAVLLVSFLVVALTRWWGRRAQVEAEISENDDFVRTLAAANNLTNALEAIGRRSVLRSSKVRFTVTGEADVAVTRDLVLEAPSAGLSFYSLWIQGDDPMPRADMIDHLALSCEVIDSAEKVHVLPIENGLLIKGFTIFLPPTMRKGDAITLRISYRCARYMAPLIRSGRYEYFWHYTNPKPPRTQSLTYEFVFRDRFVDTDAMLAKAESKTASLRKFSSSDEETIWIYHDPDHCSDGREYGLSFQSPQFRRNRWGIPRFATPTRAAAAR